MIVIEAKSDALVIETKRSGDPDREVSPRKEDRDINDPEAGPMTGNETVVTGRIGVIAEAVVRGGETTATEDAEMDGGDLHHLFGLSTGVVVVGMIGQGLGVVLMT